MVKVKLTITDSRCRGGYFKKRSGIYTDMHAFDMMAPDDPRSIEAIETFNRRFAAAQQRCFAPQS